MAKEIKIKYSQERQKEFTWMLYAFERFKTHYFVFDYKRLCKTESGGQNRRWRVNLKSRGRRVSGSSEECEKGGEGKDQNNK